MFYWPCMRTRCHRSPITCCFHSFLEWTASRLLRQSSGYNRWAVTKTADNGLQCHLIKNICGGVYNDRPSWRTSKQRPLWRQRLETSYKLSDDDDLMASNHSILVTWKYGECKILWLCSLVCTLLLLICARIASDRDLTWTTINSWWQDGRSHWTF